MNSIQRGSLITGMISSFITPFLGGALNVALPQIAAEYHFNSIMLSWVSSAFLLSTVIFLVPFGRIADLYGRKKIFFLGSLLTIVGMLLAITSHEGWVFMLSRVVQGAGGAMIFGTGMAIVTSVFPPQKRGLVFGLTVSCVYLGGALGPSLGGILVQGHGWRSVFVITLVIMLAIPVLILTTMKEEWADAKGEDFDAGGAVLYVASVLAIFYGVSLFPSVRGIALSVLGLGLLGLFIKVEAGKVHPLFNVRLFVGNPVFAMSNLAAFTNYCATFGVGFLMGLYLQFIKGLSPRQAGVVMFVQPLVMALLSPVAGRRSDSVEPRILASIGMGFCFAGLVLLSFLGHDTSIPYVVLCMATLGVGFGLFSSPNTNAIMTSVEKRFLGTASSTVGTMRLMGQMVSMGIVMTLFSLLVGRVKIQPENYAQFLTAVRYAFVIFAALCALGLWASLKRGNMHLQNKKAQA